MCALTAGQRGRKVLLLEHTDKAGAKILISGGGRCNFTNLDSAPGRFASGNPHFCTSALSRYTQSDFIALVQRHRIPFHEKTLGQLFCDGSARAIVAMLLEECAPGGVDLRLGQTVSSVVRGDQFRVETTSGSFTAPALVLATGGLSIPKMGATGFSHSIARQFGLRVTETSPGLVPFTADADQPGLDGALAGVSLEAIASYEKQSFRESILFTHRGLSGPAILQISSYWRQGSAIVLDLLPDLDAKGFLVERKRARPKASPQTVLAEIMPARLAQALAALHLPQADMANISDRALADFAGRLKSLGVSAGWNGRLCKGRGDARRHRHARLVVKDDGRTRRRWALCHRRSRRRHRLARRLQFSMGLVQRLVGADRAFKRITRSENSSRDSAVRLPG